MSSPVTIGTDKVAALGYGTMNLTWAPTVKPDDQAFAALKAAIDGSATDGVKTLINAGHFYSNEGPKNPTNLKLLARFFDKYPEYRSKVFISVKGGMETPPPRVDCSLEFLEKDVKAINSHLGSKMDLFEPARLEPGRDVEEIVKSLAALRDEGHFRYIGLSEVSANTLRKAQSVTPIAAVELEYSPWALEVEKNGQLAVCKEFNIALIAYSPLGRGFLTGTIRSPADIPEGDFRHHFDRFQAENFPKNLELVDKIKAIADKKGVTPSQLVLAWLKSQWQGVLPIPGSTRVEGVEESLGSLKVALSEEELAEVRKVVDSAEVVGGRYFKAHEVLLEA